MVAPVQPERSSIPRRSSLHQFNRSVSAKRNARTERRSKSVPSTRIKIQLTARPSHKPPRTAWHPSACHKEKRSAAHKLFRPRDTSHAKSFTTAIEKKRAWQ